MIIRAELKCKQTGCEADPCAVDKVIELPSPRFRLFSRALLADYDFIAENKNAIRHDEDARHCLLILDAEGKDGFLVDPQGYNYARYSAFVPNARSLLTPDMGIDRSYLSPAEPWRDESRDEMLRMTLRVDGKPDYTLVLPADEDYLDAVKNYLDIPELDGISNEVFEMLDFAGIGRMMRCSENGVFVGSLYVLQNAELTTAPPVQKTLPEKPGYLFRLTLGLHPDYGDDRTVTLNLPASEKELEEAQGRLGTLQWENTVVLDYDGVIPYAAEFADLPMEMEAFNEFAKAVKNIPARQVQPPKLKALLEQFEVRDIETALFLTEHLADYILTPEISSPQEAALDQLCFIMDREEAVRLIPYVNLFNYGETVIHADNAALTSYGLLHRADYQPMLTPVQKASEANMTMR